MPREKRKLICEATCFSETARSSLRTHFLDSFGQEETYDKAHRAFQERLEDKESLPVPISTT